MLLDYISGSVEMLPFCPTPFILFLLIVLSHYEYRLLFLSCNPSCNPFFPVFFFFFFFLQLGEKDNPAVDPIIQGLKRVVHHGQYNRKKKPPLAKPALRTR